LRRFSRNQASKPIKAARPSTPPTTPPAIAPVSATLAQFRGIFTRLHSLDPLLLLPEPAPPVVILVAEDRVVTEFPTVMVSSTKLVETPTEEVEDAAAADDEAAALALSLALMLALTLALRLELALRETATLELSAADALDA